MCGSRHPVTDPSGALQAGAPTSLLRSFRADLSCP